jgi:type IV secretory pathway ATPase VirB11/archaellum biosynthesis ATPase
LIDEDLGGSPVVLQRSLPPEKDLVRVVEMEGCVLATERFVEAALRLRLADIVLDEVRTV